MNYLVQGARREGELVYYGTLPIDEFLPLARVFNGSYRSLALQHYFSPRDGILSRTLTEARAGRHAVDVVQVDLSYGYQLLNANLVQPYAIAGADQFYEGTYDPGGFWHSMYYLTTAQQLHVVKYEWIAQTFGVLGFATSKTSVALQIRRILDPNNRQTRWLLWFIICLTCTVCGIDYIFGFVQCTPPRAMWEPWVPHKCWDTSVQTGFSLFFSGSSKWTMYRVGLKDRITLIYASVVWNIFIDLVLAAIPVPVIWHTSLSVKQRVAACALLGLGPL